MTCVNSPSPLDLSQELVDLTLRDLFGPANGPDEVVTEERVSSRYAIRILEPRDEAPDTEPIETLTNAVPDTEDGRPPAPPMMRQTAIGLTFSVTAVTQMLEVTARWGQYTREKSDEHPTAKGNPGLVWQQYPREGTVRLALRPGSLGPVVPVPEQPGVFVRGRRRDRAEAHGRVELVWTGPDPGQVPLRRTNQVLLEVIDSAVRTLLIVSFTVHEVPAVAKALERTADWDQQRLSTNGYIVF